MDKELLKDYVLELLSRADDAFADTDKSMSDLNAGVLLGIQIAFDLLKNVAIEARIDLKEIGLDFDFETLYTA